MNEEEYKIYEDEYGDIICVLTDGYKARFFLKGLSDEEYIKRTKQLQSIDNKKQKFKVMQYDLANNL